MGKFVPDSVTIASIWPGKLRPIQKYVGESPNRKDRDGRSMPRCTTYELKPVGKRDEPYTTEVTDAFESKRDWIQSAEQGREINSLDIVDCHELAENLIREWSGNLADAPPGAGMGIRMIRGSVPHQDELREMRAELAAFCQWQFQTAERHARLNEWKEITPTMRECTKWLGHERLYSEPAKSGDMMACPACREQISSEALVCSKCGTRIKALTAKLAALNPPEEPVELAPINEPAEPEEVTA